MAQDHYVAWSHRWGGIATLEVTDSSGTYTISTSASVAADRDFCHLGLDDVRPDERDAANVNLNYNAFAPWLKAALDAASARTYTVAWSTAALAYTISVDSGTVVLTFPATPAGERMRRILGFTASKSAAASHTSDCRPWYVIRAAKENRSAYDQPAVRDGQVRTARTDGGVPYTLAPRRLVKSARWELRFEPKAAVHRRFAASDTLVGGASWTWEDAFDHAARYGVPCVMRDATESMVFYSSTPFERSSFRRRAPDVDPQQTVVVTADAIAGYL